MSELELTANEILNFIPQQKPFRFIEEIISVNKEKIVGAYTFKEDEFFYAGHFPGKPITPGVILLEAMCQVGVVALGIYLYSTEVPRAEINKLVTVLTESQLEVFKPVLPGTRVIMTSEKIFWRRMKLRAKIEMYDEEGNLLASCIASGMGVLK